MGMREDMKLSQHDNAIFFRLKLHYNFFPIFVVDK